jgi:hypothetical protein
MAQSRHLRTIGLVGAVGAGLLALLLPGRAAPTSHASSSARAHGRTKVVCVDEDSFDHDAKFRPHHCIFHKRHAPNAEAFFVRTKHDHWKVWRHRRARGRGIATASMTGDTRVKIRLFHPVTRCGRRVFSKAHFRFPEFHSGRTVKLSTCATR